MSRRLVMSRDDLIRWITHPEFHKDCPAFADLQDEVATCQQAFEASARCCGGDAKLMFPALDAMFARLRELQTTDPAALETARRWLAAKKGYEPRPVVIYYRKGRTGKPDKFSF